MQFPVLWHGENVVPDSSAVVEYLHNTYPAQMAPLIPADETRYAFFSGELRGEEYCSPTSFREFNSLADLEHLMAHSICSR